MPPSRPSLPSAGLDVGNPRLLGHLAHGALLAVLQAELQAQHARLRPGRTLLQSLITMLTTLVDRELDTISNMFV